MSNMLDYLRWRGDLSMGNVPVGEVDGLILSQLSMLFWENAWQPGEPAALRDLAPELLKHEVAAGFTAADDRKLIEAVGNSERFGGIRLLDYTHRFDEAESMQFAAIAMRLGDGTLFIAFRGTDSTIVGWKEDCQMAYAKPVPAQQAAAVYLSRMAGTYEGPIRVGGHSKGGNLAMFAAAMAPEAVLGRITDIYNNDGPGLSDRVDTRALYARLGGRLKSFLPQSSIVGLLLSHPGDYEVVRSDSVSIWQHNPYSWQVEGPRFVRAGGLSRDSARFDAAFRQWLGEVDEDERAVLVETLFGVLSAGDANRFGKSFLSALARNPRPYLSAIQNIDPEARKRIARLIMEFASVSLRQDAPDQPR